MIYAAFIVWLFLIIFMGIGVYRLWAHLVRPAWVNWVLLPGTVVSEMAYIFGSLITGGEIRRAKLLDLPSKDRRGGSGEPSTEANPRLKIIGPIIASLLVIVACAAALLAVHYWLGRPVINEFYGLDIEDITEIIAGKGMFPDLPRTLPTSWDAFWNQAMGQVQMLQRTCETWAGLKWTDWRVPVFVYLTVCLSVRLAPVNRPLGSTLLAVLAIALVIGLVGAISSSFEGLMQDVWPLLSYIWANLLFLLMATLIIYGIVALVRNLRSGGGRGGAKAGKAE